MDNEFYLESEIDEAHEEWQIIKEYELLHEDEIKVYNLSQMYKNTINFLLSNESL